MRNSFEGGMQVKADDATRDELRNNYSKMQPLVTRWHDWSIAAEADFQERQARKKAAAANEDPFKFTAAEQDAAKKRIEETSEFYVEEETPYGKFRQLRPLHPETLADDAYKFACYILGSNPKYVSTIKSLVRNRNIAELKKSGFKNWSFSDCEAVLSNIENFNKWHAIEEEERAKEEYRITFSFFYEGSLEQRLKAINELKNKIDIDDELSTEYLQPDDSDIRDVRKHKNYRGYVVNQIKMFLDKIGQASGISNADKIGNFFSGLTDKEIISLVDELRETVDFLEDL